MIFTETPLSGAFVIDLERREDDRGFFARAWCRKEFEEHGLRGKLCQANVTFNQRKGTVRGMHMQRAPYSETKLLRCIAGAIFDVIIDMRPESSTYLRWFGIELNADNRRQLYIPDGFAHGYQTLTDKAELTYQMGEFYVPDAGTGFRWDDPVFRIEWPLPVTVISEKDAHWPLLNAAQEMP